MFTPRDTALYRRFSIVILLLGLAGCHPPDSQPVDLTSQLVEPAANAPGAINKAFMAPGGNYSMVVLRQRQNVPDRPELGSSRVLCTAPSPDWATALAMAQQLQGSGSVASGPSASLTASNSLSETVSVLAGRTAGVVALRDGLYKACEAYANGVIGKDAYALILSQYGNLLVSLAGGGGGGGAGTGAPPGTSGTSAAPPGVAVAVSTGAAPTGSATGNSTNKAAGGGPGQESNPVVDQMRQQVLQAMLVACVNETDPTVRPVVEENQMLHQDVCPSLFQDVVKKLPDLLASGQQAPPKPATATVGTARTMPNPAITEMQKALNADCSAGITVDGIYGSQTDKALLAASKTKCYKPG